MTGVWIAAGIAAWVAIGVPVAIVIGRSIRKVGGPSPPRPDRVDERRCERCRVRVAHAGEPLADDERCPHELDVPPATPT